MLCKKCAVDKDNEEFSKGRRVCKKCASAKCMEWAKNNAEKVLENSKRYREENREKCRKRCLELYHKQPWKNKKWREENSEKQKQYQKKYREKNIKEVRERRSKSNREKRIHETPQGVARKAVYMAIKRGDLERANNCQMCNKECKSEAHHGDYNKTLEVIWVCKPCHGAIHMALNRKAKEHGK